MPYPLSSAKEHAKSVHDAIAPYCLRVEVAGSTRREAPSPKDIELVAVPKPECLSELKAVANTRWGTPKAGAFPSKYTQIRSVLNLDLFWATRENFGMLLFIRTGPSGFVARALAHWKKVSDGGHSDGGILWKPDGHGGFEKVPTLEEADVFEVLKCHFVLPQHRYDTVEEQSRHYERARSDARKNKARAGGSKATWYSL